MFRIATDLHRDGFAVLEFPDSRFSERAERIKGELHAHYDWNGYRAQRMNELRVQDAWEWNDDVRSLAANSEVLALLSRLYGREAFPFQTLNFPVGTQQHFHTDSVHFSSMPERFMCGVWVALEDIGEDQGPLIYYPGSHRWPIYTNAHIGHSHVGSGRYANYYPMWERLVEAHGVEPRRFLPKKGQALIWAANLLHGGDAHRNRALTRWSQVTHYYFEGCAYYTPLASDEPAGSVFFRKPKSVADGQMRENFYNGAHIPGDYITFVSPAQAREREPVPADFDPVVYLSRNPDVAAAGADAAGHYLAYGRKEGRAYR